MKHIIRIKEGRFFTKISLKDDKNKRSSIWYNSNGFRRERAQMGIARQMDKAKRLVHMYNDINNEDDKVTTYDLKEETYHRISTVATLAIERAFIEGKLEKETVKEILDGFFEDKQIREQKDLDDLKFEIDSTKALKKVKENNQEESIKDKEDGDGKDEQSEK